MPTFIAGMLALYLVLSAIKRFGRITPAEAAKILRKGGPALSIASVALMLFRGPLGLVGALLGLIAQKLNRPGGGGGGPGFQSAFRDVGSGAGKSRRSTARSATLEMRLDLDTGAVGGSVISGPFVGRELDALSQSQCMTLHAQCRASDPEGAALLETYLDRRFARWREADEGEAQGRGLGGSGGGAMSRNEAYEVLGLPKGAGAEEIVRAHRSLMKKLHPDHGGSTALAARVNQAKDVLLGGHG